MNMRSARHICCAFLALVAMSVAAYAQDTVKPDPIHIPAGGQPLRIERIADIPEQLRAAIARDRGCRLEDWLMSQIPIVVFKPAKYARPVAIVTCAGIVPYSRAYVFDRLEPVPMMFAVPSAAGGFAVTARPGVMDWNPATKRLVATQHNDLCPSKVARYTYYIVRSRPILVKFERGNNPPCNGQVDWQLLWNAKPWNERFQ